MRSGLAPRVLVLGAACWIALGVVGAEAPAQVTSAFEQSAPGPAWIVLDPSKRSTLDRETRMRLVQQERELRKLRYAHFGRMRVAETRQLGLLKLAEFTDPALFQTMIETFRNEKEDVRAGLLDHFLDRGKDAGLAAIAWVAVFERDPAFRELAFQRLARASEAWEPHTAPVTVEHVIAAGLKHESDRVAGTAAKLAQNLSLFGAIPLMIAAQVSPGAAGGDDGTGALAYIMVAEQQTFVQDLEPVVGDAAVGFDPQIGVVSEGTVLAIYGASVVTYRTIVHTALRGLAEAGWDGRSTRPLGYELDKWREWYKDEFKPYRENLAKRRDAEARIEEGDGGGPN